MGKQLLLVGAFALCSWLSAVSWAGDDGWELARERDGIRIYTRPVEGSDYKAFRGEVLIEAGINPLMAVMDDLVGNCPQLMYNCRGATLLEKTNLLDRHYHMVNRFPWPVTDRDMVVRSLIDQDADTRVTTVSLFAVAEDALTEVARERLPEGGRLIRITRLEGFFRFIPEGDSRSRAVYQLHMEPQGSLPPGIVNAMIVDTPFETLKNLRELAQAPEYQCFTPF